MDIHNLIHMANRIGQFFESYSDRAEALEGISTHLKKFWDPRMRRLLLERFDASSGGGDDGFSPLLADALRAHRSRLQ